MRVAVGFCSKTTHVLLRNANVDWKITSPRIKQGNWKSHDHKSKMVGGNDITGGTRLDPPLQTSTKSSHYTILSRCLRDKLCTENYEFSSSQMCCHWWHCMHKNNSRRHKWRQSWCHENYWLSVARVQILYMARVDASTGLSCTHFPVLAQFLVEWGGPAAGGAYKR